MRSTSDSPGDAAPTAAASKASLVRAALRRHPFLSSTEIGHLVGVSCEYVRVIKRRTHAAEPGAPADALGTAVRAYQRVLTLRQLSAANPRDLALYGRYVEAWAAQKLAERAFLLEAENPGDFNLLLPGESPPDSSFD